MTANSKLAEPIRHVEADAVLIAMDRGDDAITTEHLLLGALTNVHVEQYLRFLSVDQNHLTQSLNDWMAKSLRPNRGKVVVKPGKTIRCERVLARFHQMEAERLSKYKPENFGEQFIAALLPEQDSVAVQQLIQHGLSIALPEPFKAQAAEFEHVAVDSKLRAAIDHFAGFLARWKARGVPHEEVMHVINCLVVNPLEDQLDALVARLARVPDKRREDLSKALATLVLAPDSASTKEKVLMGIVGDGAFGYQQPDIRRKVRELLSSDEER